MANSWAVGFSEPSKLQAEMWPAALIQLGGIDLHPTPDATGVDLNTTFRQEFGNVLVSERVSQVPSDAQKQSPRQGNGAL
jgi:hypothetical protein